MIMTRQFPSTLTMVKFYILDIISLNLRKTFKFNYLKIMTQTEYMAVITKSVILRIQIRITTRILTKIFHQTFTMIINNYLVQSRYIAISWKIALNYIIVLYVYSLEISKILIILRKIIFGLYVLYFYTFVVCI